MFIGAKRCIQGSPARTWIATRRVLIAVSGASLKQSEGVQQEALAFVRLLLDIVPRICLENP